MIPKLIHYCWFGGAEKPEIVKQCIESWKKYFPDWKICEWNESNYDINKCQYIKDAYQLRKWAFVSDFARFDILNQYGGIYVDVDVEFIKKIPEKYLKYSCFTGFEGAGEVNPGLIFAVEPHHWFVKTVLESYKHDRFYYNEKGIYKTVNTRTTEILCRYGLKQNNQYQVIQGIHIFPSEYFCGYDTDIREPEITNNTVCWHHYLGTWSQKTIKIVLQDFLKKIIGEKLYKKLVLAKRNIKNGSYKLH